MVRLRTLVALAAAATLTACGGSPNPAATVPLRSASSSGSNALPAYTFVDLGAGPNGGAAVAFTANGTHQAGDFVHGRGSCGKDCSFNIYHALAWKGSGSVPVDITPPLINFVEAWAYGGSGSILVGTGVTNNGGYFGYKGSPHERE